MNSAFICKIFLIAVLISLTLGLAAPDAQARPRKHEDKYEDVISAKQFAHAMVVNLMTLQSREDYQAKIIKFKDYMTAEACRNHIMFLKNYNLYEDVSKHELPMSTILWDVRIGLKGYTQITIIDEDKNDQGLQNFNFMVPIQVTFDKGWKTDTYNVITSVHVTQAKAGSYSWVLSDWDTATETERKFTRPPMDYSNNRANEEDVMCKQNLIEKLTLPYFKYR